jgi:hypothetical protein
MCRSLLSIEAFKLSHLSLVFDIAKEPEPVAGYLNDDVLISLRKATQLWFDDIYTRKER